MHRVDGWISGWMDGLHLSGAMRMARYHVPNSAQTKGGSNFGSRFFKCWDLLTRSLKSAFFSLWHLITEDAEQTARTRPSAASTLECFTEKSSATH